MIYGIREYSGRMTEGWEGSVRRCAYSTGRFATRQSYRLLVLLFVLSFVYALSGSVFS